MCASCGVCFNPRPRMGGEDGTPSVDILGQTVLGFSTGEAMAEMERR
ncbi:MAG: hypothetical protein PHI97_31115 [Desulfobulbus sp.]|nr:hypothetical protein [Desulfobulbus sp.]